MMRILFDARGVQGWSDGLSNYIRYLVTGLLRLDAVNDYVLLLSPAGRKALADIGLLDRPNVHPVVTTIPFMGLEQQVRIPQLARRMGRTALYHYPHFDMPLFVHPRSVVTIFDLNHARPGYFDSLRYPKWLYSLGTTRLSVSRARRIITISQATKNQLLQRFPWLDPQAITVTYVGLGDRFLGIPDRECLEALRRKYQLGADRFILYVGTQRPHKNVRRLLEAYGRLRRHAHLPHKLLLVGGPHEDRILLQLIKVMGLEHCVRRLGYVSDEELPLVYRLADVFAFCSISEGFGMPLLEAMASNVPIVTSQVGAMAEVAGDCAVLVDPFSVESIAEGLLQVLASEAVRNRLVTKGAERVKAFTWEETARRTLEVYARVANGRSGSSLSSAGQRADPRSASEHRVVGGERFRNALLLKKKPS